jgi:hypothetical protein
LNKNLVYFSIFLIFIGIGFGIYLISLLGAILLIPGLLSPTRLPAPRIPAPASAKPPRRIIPPTPAHPTAPASEPQPMATSPSYTSVSSASMDTPMQYQGYTGPLFPAPMFPSLSQMGAPPSVTIQPPPPTNQGRDELLEVGAILAVLKLLSG